MNITYICIFLQIFYSFFWYSYDSERLFKIGVIDQNIVDLYHHHDLYIFVLIVIIGLKVILICSVFMIVIVYQKRTGGTDVEES